MKEGESIILSKERYVVLFEEESKMGTTNMPLFFSHQWIEEDLEGKIIKIKKYVDTNGYPWIWYKIATKKIFVTRKYKNIISSCWISEKGKRNG